MVDIEKFITARLEWTDEASMHEKLMHIYINILDKMEKPLEIKIYKCDKCLDMWSISMYLIENGKIHERHTNCSCEIGMRQLNHGRKPEDHRSDNFFTKYRFIEEKRFLGYYWNKALRYFDRWLIRQDWNEEHWKTYYTEFKLRSDRYKEYVNKIRKEKREPETRMVHTIPESVTGGLLDDKERGLF